MTMLKYLIILLDDTAVSFCHYPNGKSEKRPISIADLKAGILFAMKQNLMIHYVYPSYDLPAAYRDAIETTDHVKIIPAGSEYAISADVRVFDSWEQFSNETQTNDDGKVFVLRTGMQELFHHSANLESRLNCISRLNIVITDMETFSEEDFDAYRQWLSDFGSVVAESYRKGKLPEINLLTDRITLNQSNGCNAGCEHITLAPNGRFYQCPAFYLEDEDDSIGEPKIGLNLKNPQLYRLEYAPLCRHCDAFQCKRCVWLNRKTTLEINTPSREQCVVAHLERNASADICNQLKPAGFFADVEIPVIDYTDPFDIRDRF